MQYTKEFIDTYSTYRASKIRGRYITDRNIEPLMSSYSDPFNVEVVGESVLEKPIHTIKIGSGRIKLMMWSQMHGNESTTTKAVFDLLNYINTNKAFKDFVLENFSICIIPMLNPDGAEAYTRVNSNKVDLNRDAQNLSQPESKALRGVFDSFRPDFCFNLHDQRTIFSAGKTNRSATVSFLTPAEDKERKVTSGRKRSMELIVKMNEMLQNHIPGQVGRYDDGFNLNCVGDTFQSMGIPTVLFESGHYPDDYEREKTRKYIAFSLVTAIEYLGTHDISGKEYQAYFDIPENEKLFYDVILRKCPVTTKSGIEAKDVAVLFKETLLNGKIEFIPSVEHIESYLHYYGHKELDLSKIDTDPVELHELNASYLTKFLKKI